MHNLGFDRCIRRIQKGDKSGLKEIYEAYHAYIYAIMLGVVRNKENAEDLTADYFIKLWHAADHYKSGTGHKTWMTVIARNMAIDFVRKAQHEATVADVAQTVSSKAEGGADTALQYQPSAESEALATLSFKDTIAILPQEERQIITMKIVGELTFKEIAAIMEMPMGTVTWKYQQSLEKLRRADR